jgi:hypothetical protein
MPRIKKINEFDSINPGDVTTDDLLLIMDAPSGGKETKNITLGDLIASLSGETAVEVQNAGNNRIITSDGTNTGLEGESNLTFDGFTLDVTGNIQADGSVEANSLEAGLITITSNDIVSGTSLDIRTNFSDIDVLPGLAEMTLDNFKVKLGTGSVVTGLHATVGGGRNNIASGSGSVVSGGGGIAANFTVTIASPAVFTLANHGLVAGDSVYFATTGALPTGLEPLTNGTEQYWIISDGLTENEFQVSDSEGGVAIDTSGSQSGTHTLFVIDGRENTASGLISSIGGGSKNTASGIGSVISGGLLNENSGDYSVIGGGINNTITGTHSTIPGGTQAKTNLYGEVSHAAGQFESQGDAQHIILVARRETSVALGNDSTANQVLFLDGSSARLTIPAQTAWGFTINLTAYNSTDEASARFLFNGLIQNNTSNTVTIEDSTTVGSWKSGAMAAVTASVVADNSNKALEIRVTGLAAKTIRWVATVDLTQVSAGTP